MKYMIRYFCILLCYILFFQGVFGASQISNNIPLAVFQSLGIELTDSIATTYFAWDSILIQGRVTNRKEYAFLYLQNIQTKEEITELVRTDASGNFRIPVSLPKTEWKYYIIIASGNSFESSTPQTLTLLPKSTARNRVNPTQFVLPRIVYWGYPYLSIGSDRWANMSIEQSRKTYETSGKILMFQGLPLVLGRARVTISGSALSSASSIDKIPTLGFTWSGNILLDRTRDRAWENLVALRIQRSLGIMQFRIKAWDQVSSTYYLTSPNGNVVKYTFPATLIDTSGFLRTNILIRQNFPIPESGVYKIETVRSNGIAYFNLPISRSQFWSIIEPMTESQKITLRNDKALISTSILKKINVIRAGLRLNPLILDSKLSRVAEEKALDMATYNYIGHVTHKGLGILDFADTLQIDISGSVWENVAGWNISDISLEDGLEESGSHRYNMINPNWKHIGIWYVLKDGKTYLCQVFSE